MKTIIKNICFTTVLGLTVSMTSCNDFMDLTPNDQYDETEVWSDPGLVQAVVNDIYAYVQHGANEHTTTGLTDDAYFTHNYGQLPVNETAVSGSDLQWFGDGACPFHWKNCYMGIYRANLVLSNIDKVPVAPGYDLSIIKGETHFLRAYLYTELVRGFGGVPLIDQIYDIESASNLSIPRSNVEACLDFIIKDINAAIELLPETVKDSELGRATKGAAMALKARIQLHLASKLYADRTVNTLECNQYKGDRNALYEAALASAKAVIQSGTYSLIDCNASTIEEITNNYHKIAISNNAEMIFTKQFASKNVKNNVSLQHGPNGYHNWAGTTPTQDLVMAFENEDGSLRKDLLNAGESTTVNPYTNREPRFYACIGYDGAVWGRERPSDSKSYDPTPLGNLQMGYYELSEGSSIVAPIEMDNKGNPTKTVEFIGFNGVDTRKSSIEDWNGSFTGYLEKKLIDGSVAVSESVPQVVPYPYIRLAEIYLIAAEACIELNKLDEAMTYLDALRNRIGRPTTKATLAVRGKSLTQTDLRDFLQNERRVELTYENSRYYDVRRWMIAPETNSKTLKGITVIGRLKPGKSAKLPYIHDENTWDYSYHVINLSYREGRKWDNKMYFAPINRDEIKRNTAMVQNPGMD